MAPHPSNHLDMHTTLLREFDLTKPMTVSSFFFFAKYSLAAIFLYLLRHYCAPGKQISLPPGPKPRFLVGNHFDMPNRHEWLTFTKWGEIWGDMVSVKVFDKQMIIINSAKIASEMLEQKGAIYSDRPVLQMGGELMGWSKTVALLPYGDTFRNRRKLIHRLLGKPSTLKPLLPMSEFEAHQFVKNVLKDPKSLPAHICKCAGALILRIAHGYEVQEGKDPFVDLADRAVHQFSVATAPGGFLVNTLPILRYLPEWAPGASFKKTARIWGASLTDMAERPLARVKQQLLSGNARPSFLSRLLEDREVSSHEENEIKWTAASMYAGGSSTTVAAMKSFFLAMTMFPEVQKKAQAEIDAVVGADRLPTFADRDHMPYMEAVLKEIHRWHTVAPTALPHRVTEDDIHEGYLIPKGTLVIPNIWKMCHDPQTYKNPTEFDPSRFIAFEGREPEIDPRNFCYGFGRRLCPAILLADASIFMTCVTSLAVFNISKHIDENGIVDEPALVPMTGTISHPAPFKCSIRPRSGKSEALILAEAIL